MWISTSALIAAMVTMPLVGLLLQFRQGQIEAGVDALTLPDIAIGCFAP